MTEKLSRREFGKLCVALAASGVLAWKAGPLNVDADADLTESNEQPFNPYFCDGVGPAPARYTGPAPCLALDDDDGDFIEQPFSPYFYPEIAGTKYILCLDDEDWVDLADLEACPAEIENRRITGVAWVKTNE